ncbi:photosynthetic reaction center subunit H [Skermanella mucosa]|uniref:photosynthetic reaction center subunit H n=1 Tax=Skermanella mucosa TaxID=1789672 RepID=UPI00192CB08F|nr:photosynthetic reaction center subunit H [Skermanella mucosa]UEM22864.1 photosynthetic reaction center subunit H [Skermanella mucosa]
METGAITSYIDVAQVVLYAFWIFFAGLIYYLHQEDKREGYPLVSDRSERSPRVKVQGYPPIPAPKIFTMRDGSTYSAPPGNPDEREIAALPSGLWPGAPLVPTGNPMVDGVGPAAWAMREDKPELTAEDENRIVPLRVAPDFFIPSRDPNPIGMEVVAADGYVAGDVREAWVDRSEPAIHYLEVEIPSATGHRIVLLPMRFCRIDTWNRKVKVKSILSHQFADVPAIKNPNQITKLEEDKITAYYASGHLYATPQRQEPLI